MAEQLLHQITIPKLESNLQFLCKFLVLEFVVLVEFCFASHVNVIHNFK